MVGRYLYYVMFNNLKPKDISALILTLTLSSILVISCIAVFLGKDDHGRIEELIAFLLGSITTIVGEYILLHLKTGKKDDEDE